MWRANLTCNRHSSEKAADHTAITNLHLATGCPEPPGPPPAGFCLPRSQGQQQRAGLAPRGTQNADGSPIRWVHVPSSCRTNMAVRVFRESPFYNERFPSELPGAQPSQQRLARVPRTSLPVPSCALPCSCAPVTAIKRRSNKGSHHAKGGGCSGPAPAAPRALLPAPRRLHNRCSTGWPGVFRSGY